MLITFGDLEHTISVVHVAQQISLLQHLAARVFSLYFLQRLMDGRLQTILGSDLNRNIREYDVSRMDEDISAPNGTSIIDHSGAGGGIDGTKSGAKDGKAHVQDSLHIARVTVDKEPVAPLARSAVDRSAPQRQERSEPFVAGSITSPGLSASTAAISLTYGFSGR